MQARNLVFLTGIIASVGAVLSCQSNSKAKQQAPAVNWQTLGTVTYDTQISALMNSYCVNCHGATGGTQNVAPNLVGYQNAQMYFTIDSLYGRNGHKLMPPQGPLSPTDIATFEAWVNTGKRQNTWGTAAGTPTGYGTGTGTGYGTATGYVTAQTTWLNWTSNYVMNTCATVGCHNGTYNPNLSNYQNAYNNRQAIYDSMNNRRMPINGSRQVIPASTDSINRMSQWLQAGAPETDTGAGTGTYTGSVTYQGNIANLINSRCLTCHFAGNSNGAPSFSTQAAARSYAQRMSQRVQAGHPQDKQNGIALTQQEISMLVQWYNTGAL